MNPKVTVRKVDGKTGASRPAATGILAIACAVLSGPHSAASFARGDLVKDAYGHGHMHEFADYTMEESGKSVVCVGVDASTDAAYSAITKDGGGTVAATAGATKPCDEFDVVIDFPAAGAVGTAGIKYRYSINGGIDFSRALALGVATSIVIPDTGITINLAAEGTVLTTTKLTFSTTAPKITNADLPGLLEALRVTRRPYEAILIDMDADATTVATCATWLLAQNNRGKFPTIVLTARRRGAEETETEYADMIAAMFEASACVDITLWGDGCDLPSTRGIMQFRPAGLPVAARGMKIGLGTDVAWVNLGPLTGAKITDDRGNPKYHDESLFPGLDDARIGALTSVEDYEGVYVNNAPLLSPNGSDFVYWQHARTLNRGCAIAASILRRQLSKGIKKKPKPGPNGERYIDEAEAQTLEGLVNAQLVSELVTTGQVDDIRLTLSRTDDVRSNKGAKVRARLECVSLAYVKEFEVEAGFKTAIQPPAAATGQ